MSKPISRIIFLMTAVAVTFLASAQDDPLHERHEIMEGVGDAARPVGQMLRGDADFDADTVKSSLETFVDAAGRFGDLFPEGSETGDDTRAAPAIWEDRAGFDKALDDFGVAARAALAANPGTLDEARPVLGPVFTGCRDCHESYRLEEEE